MHLDVKTRKWKASATMNGPTFTICDSLQCETRFAPVFRKKTAWEVAGVKTLSLLRRCTRTDKEDVLAAGRLLQRHFDQQRELDPRRPIDVKSN